MFHFRQLPAGRDSGHEFPHARQSRGISVCIALAVALICSSGCGTGGTAATSPRGSGSTGTIALPVSPATATPPSGGGSLPAESTYEVQALLVNSSNKVTPLPALALYGSPKSVVTKIFRSVVEQYESEVSDANRRISETSDKIAAGLEDLDAAEKKLVAEYEAIRPKETDGPSTTARNPLRDLSKVRAAKTKSDDWYKEAYAERIPPRKSALEALCRMKYEQSLQLLVLKAGFDNRLFAALETVPAEDLKMWKTKADGKVAITVTNEEPWMVWTRTTHDEMVAMVTQMSGDIRTRQLAEFRTKSQNPKVALAMTTEYDLQFTSRPEFKTTSVRWLLCVPDDLDDNNVLSLDQNTAYDVLDAGVASRSADGLYLKRTNAKR